MDSFLLFSFIILIASILQTSTGFGFSIVATPFLLLLFDPREAVQINLILSLVISCSLIMKIRKDIDVGMVKRLVHGSIVGLPIGIVVFLVMDMTLLKLGVGVLILLLSLLLVLNFRIAQTMRRDVTIGGVAGGLTTSIGMPGPPVLLYFSGTNTTKEKLRGTILAFYLFVYFVSLLIQVSFAGTSKEIWLSSVAGLPLVIIGLVLGQVMFKRINQRFFRLLTYVLLFFSGIYLLIQQI
ncbi:putative membrane protein YfcA [Virgibacillus natechei]|uniref:Probable membrane transporter protein n=1 Tax=Virgibacillus natechei TaxID=1216297 RepID=A0ABS4IJ71_9BACI|nr:sulfite exporter TauE/SafE family protein [Virgibacillus natechei]MBP1970966.1 putative membrane protein YfcA [Virgibacillus natechei]UZD12734.1 sulfite exporter TauE/SafE family protein [Virgibacillus natechei]